jgi:hypothetical protein
LPSNRTSPPTPTAGAILYPTSTPTLNPAFVASPLTVVADVKVVLDAALFRARRLHERAREGARRSRRVRAGVRAVAHPREGSQPSPDTRRTHAPRYRAGAGGHRAG